MTKQHKYDQVPREIQMQVDEIDIVARKEIADLIGRKFDISKFE